MELVSFHKGPQRACSLYFHRVLTQQEAGSLKPKRGFSPERDRAGPLMSSPAGLQVSSTVARKFLLFKSLCSQHPKPAEMHPVHRLPPLPLCSQHSGEREGALEKRRQIPPHSSRSQSRPHTQPRPPLGTQRSLSPLPSPPSLCPSHAGSLAVFTHAESALTLRLCPAVAPSPRPSPRDTGPLPCPSSLLSLRPALTAPRQLACLPPGLPLLYRFLTAVTPRCHLTSRARGSCLLFSRPALQQCATSVRAGILVCPTHDVPHVPTTVPVTACSVTPVEGKPECSNCVNDKDNIISGDIKKSRYNQHPQSRSLPARWGGPGWVMVKFLVLLLAWFERTVKLID